MAIGGRGRQIRWSAQGGCRKRHSSYWSCLRWAGKRQISLDIILFFSGKLHVWLAAGDSGEVSRASLFSSNYSLQLHGQWLPLVLLGTVASGSTCGKALELLRFLAPVKQRDTTLGRWQGSGQQVAMAVTPPSQLRRREGCGIAELQAAR